MAKCAWHHEPVDDREKAMTELLEAVADVSEDKKEQRLLRIAAALYEAAIVQNVRQRDLVAQTGYSRETIRRHVEDERIRRGEIAPTPRYLREQQRKRRES
jgi:hypothetical protein